MIDKITDWFGGIRDYLKAVRLEMRRVTWPTWPELKSATIVVIVNLVIVSTYLWLLDNIFNKLFAVLNKHFWGV